MSRFRIILIVFICLLHTTIGLAAQDLGIFSKVWGTLEVGRDSTNHLDWLGKAYYLSPVFEATIGKEQLIWGVGKTGTLGLSPTSPGTMQLNYKINIPKYDVHYTRFMSRMETENNRWLFGHRLEGTLAPNMYVGVWELTICSDKIHPLFYIPVPLLPLYATQHIAYKTSNLIYDHNSNVMLGMDFRYRGEKGIEVYGEVAIDDFPESSVEKNPKKAGGLLGLSWDGFDGKYLLWSEYVRINNYVYTHRTAANRFLYEGQPFGHWLGMDGDLLAVGIEQKLSDKTTLSWQYHSIRKGEGDYTDNWNIKDGNSKEFLTGVIENSNQVLSKVHHRITPELGMNLTALAGISKNADHEENKSEKYFLLTLTVNYTMDFKNRLGE